MQITVTSGKGGTGKTTVATSLALSLAKTRAVRFLDCDVEAPNAGLFLKPELTRKTDAQILIPKINKERCTSCGRCVEVCQFHALAKIATTIMVFPQLCHGCGSCTWNCPEGAIEEVPNPIGIMEAGKAGPAVDFAHGVLTISEPMATPIIRQLKRWSPAEEGEITILDSPPGASCSTVETLRGSDFALLVTEPTPFGLHDLKQLTGIVKDMQIPAGVLINRENGPYHHLTEYCMANDLPILMKIPYSRKIAEGVAQGKLLIDIAPEYQSGLIKLFDEIITIVKRTGNNSLKKRG